MFNLPHPFPQTSYARRRKWMVLAIVLALLMTAFSMWFAQPLTTPAAPGGILSYEFARTPEMARAILDSWDAYTRIVAGIGLGLDFLYPLVYATAISLACLDVADKLREQHGRAAAVGVALFWGLWLAALLDYIENTALIFILLDSEMAIWPLIAFVCASVKFLFVIAGLLYGLGGWIFLAVRRLGRAEPVG